MDGRFRRERRRQRRTSGSVFTDVSSSGRSSDAAAHTEGIVHVQSGRPREQTAGASAESKGGC